MADRPPGGGGVAEFSAGWYDSGTVVINRGPEERRGCKAPFNDPCFNPSGWLAIERACQ